MSAAPLPVIAAPPLRLMVLGQALLQNDLDSTQWLQADRFASLLRRADVCFTDMETAIKGPHAQMPTRQGQFLHAADAGVLDCLKRAHVNMVSTSNNHAFDFGSPGILDAIAALDERGFVHAGTGADLAAASAPGIRHTPNGSVALVAAASGNIRDGGAATASRPGVNELRRDSDGTLNAEDVGRMLASIASAARQADIVIAYQHNHYWEKNMADVPPWQRDFAKRCLDAGASLFAGHGAPLLQGIEVHAGKPIFYDMGSMFFQTVTEPGHYPPEVWQSVIADCRCSTGRVSRIDLLPVQLNETGLGGATDMVTRGTPSLAQSAGADRILRHLADLSAPFGTKLEIADGRARLQLA